MCQFHDRTYQYRHRKLGVQINKEITDIGNKVNIGHPRHTQLSLFGHLGFVHNIAQDLFLLEQLVLVQGLLLLKVVVVLLLVLLQLIQRPLQGSANIAAKK